MLPTLNGRIQTRIFMLAVLGGTGHAAASRRSCPHDPDYTDDVHRAGRPWLVLGIGWELIYHVIQQFRWEKDWPTLFGFITCINEGALVWLLLELEVVPGIDGAGAVLDVHHRLPGDLGGDLALGQRTDAGAAHPLALLRRKDRLM